mmetsp:Transcript_37696/g.118693  ORF Transcript_37696/g.118693 Transcript_37696/m.118693 type:complete len:259 (-) Transcript_37696:310-1086(-)
MQGFAGFSLPENAEVAEAVALFGALAPVAFLSGIDSPVVSGMAANHVDGLASWLGLTELLPGSRLNGFSSPLCSWVPLLCDGVLDLVTGASDNLNLTHLPVQLAHTPAGTSAKNLAHFMQGIRDGYFRRFDYGDEAENARRYNTTRPPDFPLAAGFKVPVAMWSGARDSLATPADVARLQEALAPTGRVVHHAEVDFAHLDFTWSTRAAEAVYQPLLCMMRARLPPERGPCAAEAAAEPTPGLAAEPAAERRRSGVLQ